MAQLSPICVDLDGTLIRGDLFIESFFGYVLRGPWRVFVALFWLLKGGRPLLKRKLAERVPLNPATLPYNHEVIAAVEKYKAAGHHVLLVSGSDQLYVSSVAEHVGIFDEAIGSNGLVNFTGSGKARLLLERFGEKQFSYIGNSVPDLKVWKWARSAIVISSSPALARLAEKVCENVDSLVPDVLQTLSSIPKLIRVHQWSKNVLIFGPLFLAHQWNNLALLQQAILAFIGFSAAASFIYICNDLLDLQSDRLHLWKRRRPLASGSFNIYHLFWLLPLLLSSAAAAAFFLPEAFGLTLICYICITLSYSAVLKEVAIMDVMTLAVLYTLRLCAGAAATGVAISSWLLLFSLFLFLSLSLIKRYAELLEMKHGTARRGYELHDMQLISTAGIASGYICSLVAILYASSLEVSRLYSSPQLLWPVGILMVFWVTRLWLLTLRGLIKEDPVVFTLKDKTSYVVGLACGAFVILATKI